MAQQAVSSGLVVSLEIALTRVSDGQDLPDYAAVPDLGLPLTQQLERFVEKFARLRATVEAQSSELVARRACTSALRPAEATHPPERLHRGPGGRPAQLAGDLHCAGRAGE